MPVPCRERRQAGEVESLPGIGKTDGFVCSGSFGCGADFPRREGVPSAGESFVRAGRGRSL